MHCSLLCNPKGKFVTNLGLSCVLFLSPEMALASIKGKGNVQDSHLVAGVQGRIFQDILLIFSPKVQIWDEANYPQKKIENFFARAPFARKKMRNFVHDHTFFLRWLVMGVIFG